MAWQKGPLPAETWGWGGVVPKDQSGDGFYFADFQGDSVKTCPDGRALKPDEVALYDNSLTLPPHCKGRVG